MLRNVLIVLLTALLLLASGCGTDKSKKDASTNTRKVETVELPSELIDQVITPFNKGVALMEQYRPVEAVEAFEEVVRLAPDWITGRLNYGIALLNAQSDEYYNRAEKELEWIIARDQDNPYAHYALGMLLKHFTRLDEAQTQFEAVLRIDPEDADAHYQLGILLVDEDPETARVHLEKTLQAIPHHESACYRLQTLLRRAGEKEESRELLVRFRALKASGAGVFSGMKYGEMGRYANVIRAFEDPVDRGKIAASPQFSDIAGATGLLPDAGAISGWPGEGSTTEAAAFRPGIAVADVKGDGKYSVYITGAGKSGEGVLYHYKADRFLRAPDTGIDGGDAIGAYFGDYDGDGDPDLYLTCAGPNRLYRNEGDSRFTDITDESGIGGGDFVSVGAAWADADHDGDLDLYVANFSPVAPTSGSGAPNILWRNNGDGTFTDKAGDAGIDGGDAATTGVLFLDIDDDRDLDLYLINHRSLNRLYLNDRVGQYTEATSWFPELADDGPGLGAALGDLDGNGREDLLLIRGPEPPRLFSNVDRGYFVEDAAFAATARNLGGAVGALIGDLDLDGDLDLVLLNTGDQGTNGHRILLNRGAGRFDPPILLGVETRAPNSRGAVAMDLDGDGSLEIIVTRVGARPELWHAPAPEGRHWLEVIPAKSEEEDALWIDPTADGLMVEIKTGRKLQVASVTASAGYLGSPPRTAHFGLDDKRKADYVRLSWTDGVFQSEMEVAADQSWRITKVVRKPSSCPILFVWNGERFVFVTDFLGVGGVGFFIAPGEYAPPDPTEDVRIPPELVSVRDGRYLLRVAEPLEEVTYFDELHLVVYDHPDDREIYPDERFTGTAPFPTGKPHAASTKIFPSAAFSKHDGDVLDHILEIDRVYIEPPKDPRFVGYADDHWIELDFDNRLRHLDSEAPLVLYLYGWVEYTYSHVNYAAYQSGITMRSPWIEIPDGRGGWQEALPEIGFPAGLPRMMTVDISSLPIRESGRFRIRTNMEIFWDQIFIAEDMVGTELHVATLRPDVAELRFFGYPREFSPDGNDPTIYDYHRVDQGVPFKNMTGKFTRFGDVRPLLEAVDDQFVVMARGEEIALEFDAGALPELPQGWTRTLVLHTDGYCKDMDLYTAFPNTVDPLPYHAMENYPPDEPAHDRSALGRYLQSWNTRIIADQ